MAGKDKDSDFDEDLGASAGSVPEDLFTWIVDEKVVGMSRPGPADLAALRSCGVTHVISLTVKPLAEESLSNSMMTGIHIPALDMSAPSAELIAHFVETLSGLVEAGHKVAVHCGAGLGRTGTMLACYFVSRGMSAQEAIAEVRRRRPGSVESRDQERAVRDYQADLRSGRDSPSHPG